jgi:hypothetical protein
MCLYLQNVSCKRLVKKIGKVYFRLYLFLMHFLFAYLIGLDDRVFQIQIYWCRVILQMLYYINSNYFPIFCLVYNILKDV